MAVPDAAPSVHSVEQRGLSILMIGPVNHPHVEHLSVAVQDQGHSVTVAGWEWPALPAEGLSAAGIRVVLHQEGSTWRWLRQQIREIRPDVVHAHWMRYAVRAALFGARPLIVMAWGSDVYLARGVWRLANRFTVRNAEVLLTDSRALCGELVRLGAPPHRVAVVNWGVDLNVFGQTAEAKAGVRDRLGLPDAPTILAPRWLRSPYNPEVIVAAFDLLAEQIPDLQLVLKHVAVGAPPALARAQHRDRIHVVGHVPYEVMAEYFRAADVCVSVPSSDSSPRSVWEAMASGCPCVLSDLPWVHELIRHQEHALVVSAEPSAVADAIRVLLNQPELRDRIIASGRRLVELHRNQDTEMRKLSELYRRVAAGERRLWPMRRDVRVPCSMLGGSR